MTDKTKVSSAGCIFAMVWLPLLIAITSIYRGYVLTKLWGWFVVPTFELPQLIIPAAIGLSLIMGYLTHQTSSADNDSVKSKSLGYVVLAATLKAALLPSMSWLMGWIVSQYM